MADNVGSLAPSKSADNAGVALSNDNDYEYEDTDSVREGDTKTCKFCYGTESDGSEWLHPCKSVYIVIVCKYSLCASVVRYPLIKFNQLCSTV